MNSFNKDLINFENMILNDIFMKMDFIAKVKK